MCKVKPRGTCVTSRMFQKNSIDRTLCWQEFGEIGSLSYLLVRMQFEANPYQKLQMQILT